MSDKNRPTLPDGLIYCSFFYPHLHWPIIQKLADNPLFYAENTNTDNSGKYIMRIIW
jgi:hypothetical protein